jgi:hypothetical protein
MIMITSQEEFEKARSRDLIELKCEKCNNPFKREKHYVQSYIKKGMKNFCSLKCMNLNTLSKIIAPCGWCGKEVKRVLNQVQKSKSGKIFCDHTCACSYTSTHKTKGVRRSKLEIYLESKLQYQYPKLEIHFNRKDAINSELDIYIPKLKLAIELNGIFHYEPIYGKEKLQQIQNNDNRKFQACLEKQIELCIIDSSKLSYFKEQNAKPYLDIITNIINNKMAQPTGYDPA